MLLAEGDLARVIRRRIGGLELADRDGGQGHRAARPPGDRELMGSEDLDVELVLAGKAGHAPPGARRAAAGHAAGLHGLRGGFGPPAAHQHAAGPDPPETELRVGGARAAQRVLEPLLHRELWRYLA